MVKNFCFKLYFLLLMQVYFLNILSATVNVQFFNLNVSSENENYENSNCEVNM